MTIRRLPILGAFTQPDSSGLVVPVPIADLLTNDLYGGYVWALPETAAKIGLSDRHPVPGDYVGTPSIEVLWSTANTSGDVVLDHDYTAIGGDNAESFDPSAHQESATVTDTAGGAAHRRMVASIALTGGNFAAGDEVLFTLSRDGLSGSDTLNATAYIWRAWFVYSDA
jgi:hypothetical protein